MTSATRDQPNDITIEQPPDGYRFSAEPFLLADFFSMQPHLEILDAGTGCGIIPLLLAARERRVKITAVEIQEPLADLAVRNVRANGRQGIISVVRADFTRVRALWRAESFDRIVSNPPFRKINHGRINPRWEKAVARHEITLNLESLLDGSRYLLKPGGKITWAYPVNRFREVEGKLRRAGFYPSRLRWVHRTCGAPAKLFLMEAVKGRETGCVVSSPLYLYNGDGFCTLEMKEIYASFNYSGRSDRFGKI